MVKLYNIKTKNMGIERPERAYEQKETKREKPEVSENSKKVESSPRRDNPEEPKDKKIDEVVGSLTLGIYEFKDHLFKSEISDKDFDKIIESIKGDGFRSEIKQKIEAGYKFKNFSESGFKICWTKNGKKTVETNPLFKNIEVSSMLRDNLKSILKEKETTQNTEKSFNSIVQYLKANRFINKKLDINTIKKSGFGDEVYSALSANSQSIGAGNGEVYNIKSTRTGFILKVTEPFKKQGYTDLEYNMAEDFDVNLNRVEKKEEQPKTKEKKLQTEEEKKLIKKIAENETKMDNIASRDPEINSIHSEVKDFIRYVEKCIIEKTEEGKNPKEIREEIIHNFKERGLSSKMEELEKNGKNDKNPVTVKEAQNYATASEAVIVSIGEKYGVNLD